jgi:16S rRNA G966 N2-methylase RsmD
MEWSAIKNERFALRRLLTNEAYHASETSIPKSELVPEKEPLIRAKLTEIAKQIVAVPDSVLVDTYAEEERKKDWISLQKKVVLDSDTSDVMAIDTRTRPGHKILDHFMPHFYSVKNYKGTSVRDLFNEAALEKALMQNIQMHSTPYVSEIRRMIVMTGGLGSVTKYRTVTSKAIVLYYKAQKVLDPCAGWGGRMLGSLAAGASYVGCEPDPNTAKGLKEILGDSAIPQTVRSKARILDKPAEIALPELTDSEKFDLVLTSPPYFNLELYTAGDQSTARYTTWEEWTEKWLKPVILGCLTRLKEGGVSCWSVKNFKTDKKYPLADVTKKIHKDAGWDLVKTVTMTGSGRPGGKRIEEGKEKRESEEETFCFKRAS